jgi:hypothetical protein
LSDVSAGLTSRAITRVSAEPFVALLAIALAVTTAERIWLSRGLPLWTDESFTWMLARQPDSAAFVRQLWLDPNAPLYSLVMRLWPFASPFMLRLPSLIAVTAASLLPLLWRMPKSTVTLAAVWGIMIAAWTGSLYAATDARCYAFALLLATALTIAFAWLIEAPSRRRAAVWVAIGTALFLTEYHSAALCLVQAIALVVVHRVRVFALWPAVLAAIPGFAWIGWHLPRLLVFAQPGNSWQWRLGPAELPTMAAYCVGQPAFAMLVVALLGGVLIPRIKTPNATIVAGLTGVGALVLLLIGGLLTPMIFQRYLTSCVPGTLLSLVILAGNRVGWSLLAGFALVGGPLGARREMAGRASFSIQEAVVRLRAMGASDVVYSLGFVGQRVMDPATGSQLIEREFDRQGSAAQVKLIDARHAEDFVRAAGSERAILWFWQRPAAAEAARLETARLAAGRPCLSLPAWRGGTLICPPLVPASAVPGPRRGRPR